MWFSSRFYNFLVNG